MKDTFPRHPTTCPKAVEYQIRQMNSPCSFKGKSYSPLFTNSTPADLALPMSRPRGPAVCMRGANAPPGPGACGRPAGALCSVPVPASCLSGSTFSWVGWDTRHRKEAELFQMVAQGLRPLYPQSCCPWRSSTAPASSTRRCWRIPTPT